MLANRSTTAQPTPGQQTGPGIPGREDDRSTARRTNLPANSGHPFLKRSRQHPISAHHGLNRSPKEPSTAASYKPETGRPRRGRNPFYEELRTRLTTDCSKFDTAMPRPRLRLQFDPEQYRKSTYFRPDTPPQTSPLDHFPGQHRALRSGDLECWRPAISRLTLMPPKP